VEACRPLFPLCADSELPEDEKLALAAELKRTINEDAIRCRSARCRPILDKMEPLGPVAEPLPRPAATNAGPSEIRTWPTDDAWQRRCDQRAENWAMLASLIETCKLHSVNPQACLTDVLTKLVNNWPNRRRAELTPWAWTAAIP